MEWEETASYLVGFWGIIYILMGEQRCYLLFHLKWLSVLVQPCEREHVQISRWQKGHKEEGNGSEQQKKSQQPGGGGSTKVDIFKVGQDEGVHGQQICRKYPIDL